MKPIILTIYRDVDGVTAVHQDGIFVDRAQITRLIKEMQRFYQQVSDDEIDQYIRWTHDRRRPMTKQRKGYVYLIKSYDDFYKIGQARDPRTRINGLLLPYKPKIIHTIFVTDMDYAERFLHHKYAHRRVDGEWFLLSSAEVAHICSLQSLEPDP